MMFAVTLMSPADFFGLSEYKSYLLVFVFSLKNAHAITNAL